MSYPEISEGEIYHLIHHIFLPPKLPHSGDDPQAVAYETSLLTTTFDALRSFGSHVEPEFEYVVDEAYSAIRRLRDLRDTLGFMDEDRLRQAFYNLAQDGTYAAFCGLKEPQPLNRLQETPLSFM